MIAMTQDVQLSDKQEMRLKVRQALMLPGWVFMACIALMLFLGTGDLLTNAAGAGEKMLAVVFYVYMGVTAAIFLAAWKGKHLPYIILIAYSLIMPLGFYYLILKWFDRKK